MVVPMNGWLGRSRLFPIVVRVFVAGGIGIGSLQAALDTYGLFKGEHYRQSSASAPGAGRSRNTESWALPR
jgi:hypothetical protein